MNSIIQHVFDTDILSLYRRGNDNIEAWVELLLPHKPVITVITVREQLNGWYSQLGRPLSKEEEARVHQDIADTVLACAAFPILTYGAEDITRFEELKRLKRNVGAMDLRIASIVIGQGGILITRNTRDFERVPGLITLNWTQSIP